MLVTNNDIDFKKVNKNLKNELSKIGFEIANQSSLNLLSRTLGYKDYNTISSVLKDIDIRAETLLDDIHNQIKKTEDKINSNIDFLGEKIQRDKYFDLTTKAIDKYEYYFRLYAHKKNLLIYPDFHYSPKEQLEEFEKKAKKRGLPYITLSIREQWNPKAIKNIQIFFTKEVFSDDQEYLYEPSIREIELLLEENGIVNRDSRKSYKINFYTEFSRKNGTRDEIENLKLTWNDESNKIVSIAAVLNEDQDNFIITLNYKPLKKEYTKNSNFEDLCELAKQFSIIGQKTYENIVSRHNAGDKSATQFLFFYIINEISEGYSSALYSSLKALISDFDDSDYYEYFSLSYSDIVENGAMVMKANGYKAERDYKVRSFTYQVGY